MEEVNTLLNCEQTRGTGLRKLLAALSDEEKGQSNVTSLLEKSNKCDQVFNILENVSKLPGHELKTIWEILEYVLLTTSEVPGLHSSGIVIMQRLLQNHLKHIYTALSHASPKILVNATLKLLASVNTQGIVAVRECLNNFNFSLKSLEGISKIKPTKDGVDVCGSFLKWFLSLLIFGDLRTTRQVLGIKVFMHEVIKSLSSTAASSVILVLSTLSEKIVKEEGLLKKSKIECFNAHALSELCKLCRFGDINNEEDAKVQQLSFDLLYDLCCNKDVGIGFESKEAGLTRRSTNPILLRFLLAIKQKAAEDDSVFQITISTLKTYNDLILPYMASLKVISEPRLSTQWMASMNFLVKLWSHLPSLEQIISKTNWQLSPNNTEIVASLVIPDCIDRGTLIRGLKHPSAVVRMMTTKLLAVVARRASDLVTSGSNFSDVIAVLKTELLKLLPESSLVVAVRQKCVIASDKEEKAEEEDQKKEKGVFWRRKEDEEFGFKGTTVRDNTLLASVEVLYNYVLIWPTTFIDSGFNPCKLMVFDSFESFLENESLQKSTLKLLYCLPAKSIKWDAKKESYHQGFFVKTLQLVCSVTLGEEIKDQSKNFVMKLLCETGLFDSQLAEVYVWLSQLKTFAAVSSCEIISYFGDLCIDVSQDQFTFMDEVADASVCLSNGNYEEELDIDTPICEETSRMAFSPLVVACMHSLKKIFMKPADVTNGILDFICSALRNLVLCHSNSRVVASYIVKQIAAYYKNEPLEDCNEKLLALISFSVKWMKGSGYKVPTEGQKILKLKGKEVLLRGWKGLHESSAIDILKKYVPLTKKRLSNLLTDVSRLSSIQIATSCQFLMELEIGAIVRVIINLLQYPTLKEDSWGPGTQNAACALLCSLENVVQKLDGELLKTYVIFGPQAQTPLPLRLFALIFGEKRILELLLDNSVASEVLRRLLLLFFNNNLTLQKSVVAEKIFRFLRKWISENFDLDDKSTDHCKFNSVECYRMFGKYLPDALKGKILADFLYKTETRCAANTWNESTRLLMLFLLDNFFRSKNGIFAFFEDNKMLHDVKQLLVDFGTEALNKDPDFLIAISNSVSIAKVIHPQAFNCIIGDLDKYSNGVLNLIEVSTLQRMGIIAEVFRGTFNESTEIASFVRLLKGILLSSDSWIYRQKLGELIQNDFTETLTSLLKEDSESFRDAKKVTCEVLGLSVMCNPNDERLPDMIQDVLSIRDIATMGMTLPIIIAFLETRKKVGPKKLMKQILVRIVKCWSNSLHSKATENEELEQYCEKGVAMFLKLEGIQILLTGKLDVFTSSMEKCIKAVLSLRFTRSSSIERLVELVAFLYESKDFQATTKMSGTFLYQMVLGHSKFLDIVQGKEINEKSRALIFKLLLTIAMNCSDVCSKTHVPILLAAYHASLSITDQIILQLLELYEERDAFLDSRIFLFGTNALEYYGNQKEASHHLSSQPSCHEIFEILDAKKMLESAVNFPLRRGFSEKEVHDDTKDVYDPAFLLPMFNNLLDPGMEIDCRKFSYECCLAFVIAALSSHCEKIRTLACHVLLKFQEQLEGARFKDKNQIDSLLQHLKFGLQSRNQRITSCLCNWFIQTLQLLMRPEQHLYTMLNRYLLSHYTLDLKNLPLFFALFNSSSIKYTTERAWILRLIARGLRDQSDYYTVKRQHTLPLVASFHDSPFSDTVTRKLVLDILTSASKIHPAAFDLVKVFGLISWLTSRVAAEDHDNHFASALFQICKNLNSVFDIGGGKDVLYPQNYLFETHLLYMQLAKSEWLLGYPDLCRILLKLLATVLTSLNEKDVGIINVTKSGLMHITAVLNVCCKDNNDTNEHCTNGDISGQASPRNVAVGVKSSDLCSFLKIVNFYLSKKLTLLNNSSFLDWIEVSKCNNTEVDDNQDATSKQNVCEIFGESDVEFLSDLLLSISTHLSSLEVVKETTVLLHYLKGIVNTKGKLLFDSKTYHLLTTYYFLLSRSQSYQLLYLNFSAETEGLDPMEYGEVFFKFIWLFIGTLVDFLNLVINAPESNTLYSGFQSLRTCILSENYTKVMASDVFKELTGFIKDNPIAESGCCHKTGLVYILLTAFLEDVLVSNINPDRYKAMIEMYQSTLNEAFPATGRKVLKQKKRKLVVQHPRLKRKKVSIEK